MSSKLHSKSCPEVCARLCRIIVRAFQLGPAICPWYACADYHLFILERIGVVPT
jgi:hypothetical protein